MLFGQGARDPAWAAPFEFLRDLIQPQLQQLAVDGIAEVSVVPIFLGQGSHVRRDLPALIEQARQQYPHMLINVAQAVGEPPDVLNAIAQHCVSTLPAASS